MGNTKGQKFTTNGDPAGTGDYKAQYDPWLAFKKTTQVPQNVIVAVDGVDSATALDNDNFRFMNLGDLITKHRIGWPHLKKSNFLFYDGTVHTINPWDKSETNPYSNTSPKGNPLLTSNLIVAKEALLVPNQKTFLPTQVWARGQNAPF
jgi:hypothetical protein